MKPRIYGLEHEYAIFCQNPAVGPNYLVDAIMDVFADNFSNLYSNFPQDRNRSFFLQNGARFYNDQDHPEFCTPETTNPLNAAKYAKTEEKILDYLLMKMVDNPKLKRENPGQIYLLKNNVDCQENPESYGCHENYSILPHIFQELTTISLLSYIFMSFLVTRQIICGAGHVKLLQNGWEYQINQRTPFTVSEISADFRDRNNQTQRGIINAKDEYFSTIRNPKLKRLHLTLSDSNMSEFVNYLKMGMTALVLEMIEEYFLTKVDFSKFALKYPLEGLRRVNNDLSLKREKLTTEDDQKFTALEIQEMFLEKAQIFFQRSSDITVKNIIRDWSETLNNLKNNLTLCFGKLDWVTKKFLIEDQLKKIDKETFHKLKIVDMQYHSIEQKKGLYYILEKNGKTKKLFSDTDLKYAQNNAPLDTRAFIRGQIIKEASIRNWQNYIELDWCYARLWRPFNIEDDKTCLYLNDPFENNWEPIKQKLLSFYEKI